MEIPASLLSTWLPTQKVPITVTEDDGKVTACIPGIGDLSSRRLVNDLGNNMTMQNSAFSIVFGFEGHIGDLAPSDGTAWKDPDMPERRTDLRRHPVSHGGEFGETSDCGQRARARSDWFLLRLRGAF